MTPHLFTPLFCNIGVPWTRGVGARLKEGAVGAGFIRNFSSRQFPGLHKIPRGGFYLGVLIGTTDPAQLVLSHVTCHVSCQPPLSPSRCCCLKVSWKWQILGGSLPKVYMCYPIGQGEPWDPPPQNANFFLSWIFGTLTFLANLLENFRWKTFSPRASGYAENQANIPKKCPLTGGGGRALGIRVVGHRQRGK